MMVAIGNFAFRFRNYLFPLALPLVLLPGPRIFDEYWWRRCWARWWPWRASRCAA